MVSRPCFRLLNCSARRLTFLASSRIRSTIFTSSFPGSVNPSSRFPLRTNSSTPSSSSRSFICLLTPDWEVNRAFAASVEVMPEINDDIDVAIDPKDVRVVNQRMTEAVTSFISGAVPAVALWVPFDVTVRDKMPGARKLIDAGAAAVSDPALDLATPLKGPFATVTLAAPEGEATTQPNANESDE